MIRTFLSILHKQNSISLEFYNQSYENRYEFFNCLNNIEFKQDNSNMIAKSILFQSLFEVNKLELISIKDKYEILNKVRKNIFITGIILETLYSTFQKAQKTYFVLTRFLRKWRISRYPKHNTFDLCFTPFDDDIEESQKPTLEIIQNKQRYLFSINDLNNIIDMALTNCAGFNDINPQEIKNPYTNVPFSVIDHYNIYFFLKEHLNKTSILMDKYFRCDFDFGLFEINSLELIRYHYIKRYIDNSTTISLFDSIDMMLFEYEKRIKIDNTFPKIRLVEIMKPYLYIYLLSKYAYSYDMRKDCNVILKSKLREFHLFNTVFGRKIHVLKNNRIDSCSYNERCPEFVNILDIQYFKDFEKRQLEMKLIYDIENDSDSDYNSSDYNDTGVNEERNGRDLQQQNTHFYFYVGRRQSTRVIYPMIE